MKIIHFIDFRMFDYFRKKKSKMTESEDVMTSATVNTSGVVEAAAADSIVAPVDSSLAPLISYKTSRVKRVHFNMNNMAKCICLFLDATLPLFNNLNLLLQRDSPCIHKLNSLCVGLLTDLYVRFVKPNAIKKAKTLFTEL